MCQRLILNLRSVYCDSIDPERHDIFGATTWNVSPWSLEGEISEVIADQNASHSEPALNYDVFDA